MGVTSGDILDVINSWGLEEQKRARQVIAEIEAQALIDMQTMPGIRDLCDNLDRLDIPR